jgi:hypothetical protein
VNLPKKSANLSCSNVHPANLIRLPIQEINYGSSNTIGFVNVHILYGKADGRDEMVKKLQDIAY